MEEKGELKSNGKNPICRHGLLSVFIFIQFSLVFLIVLFYTEMEQVITPRFKSSVFYSKFSVKSREIMKPRKVKLLIAVLSAHKRLNRRMAVRETWWKSCQNYKEAKCIFFTDNTTLVDNDLRTALQKEKETYQDMIFLPTHQGMFFGHRFLYILEIGTQVVDPEYILRIDDDVLLCIDHLMHDLPSFPKIYFQWGHLHCFGHDLVYIDEGITMFSRDIVNLFLSQNLNTSLCHPYGDQTYSLWIQALSLYRQGLYHIDTRIHHSPPASRVPALRQEENICQKYIALHGVYNDDYKFFWSKRGKPEFSNNHMLLHPSDVCQYAPNLDWRLFTGQYRHEPFPCSDDRALRSQEPSFAGRQRRSFKFNSEVDQLEYSDWL